MIDVKQQEISNNTNEEDSVVADCAMTTEDEKLIGSDC